MGLRGRVEIGLFAVLAVLALPSAAAASTTITVNSETDAPLESGASTCKSTDAKEDCTLLAAVELANEVSLENSGETVTVDVPEGKYEKTLPGSEGELYVKEGASIVIDGAGAGKTTIDGGGVDEDVLEVEEGAALKVDGVTVQHGHEDDGGGFYVSEDGALTVEDSTITDNEAEYGGGIFGEFFSSIVINDSTITDNEAEYGGGVAAEFGSYVAVSGSTIDENTAERAGGGVWTELIGEDVCAFAKSSSKAGAKAATLSEDSGAELTVEQSTIDHNTAGGWGGGIFAWQDNSGCLLVSHAGHASARAHAHVSASTKGARPALIGFDAANLAIEQSTIAYNRAEENEGEGGYGGGIYEEGSIDDPIVNSTIAENFATRDAGGIAAAAGDFEALINDTVFNNTVEPVTAETAAKLLGHAGGSKGKLAHAAAQEQLGPGNNLATETDNGSEIDLRNTIVAEPKGQENCEGEIYSLVDDSGYNLDYPSKAIFDEPYDTCGLEEEHNLVGVNPQLEEELKNNGGPTQTLALQSSSPAIGFVPMAKDCEEPESGFGPAMRNEEGEVLPPVDQRGEKRPGLPGRGCDVGAYEYQAPPVTPTPPTETTTTTTTTAPATPAPATASVLPFKITVSPQCTSKRDITIHIQNVKQFGIVSAVISIDGHSKKTLTGRHLSAAINLRGLPAGTFTIEIVARTRKGHELTGKRVYHTCHSKLPGHSYLPL